MFSLAADGTAEPLDDWLEEFPTLKEAVSQDRWNCMRYDGKLIAVPSNNPSAVAIGFEVRADVLDELGIDAATSTLWTICTPCCWLPNSKTPACRWCPFWPDPDDAGLRPAEQRPWRATAQHRHRGGKPVRYPGYEELCNQMHQWYTEGLILKDAP